VSKADARLALTTLGFRPREASAAVTEARRTLAPSAPLEELVREALRRLA
jgi:Holliday junction resolvasome RuvABC DNA-binding subunit